ncbi:MAG: ChaN family lipoprotein, partial [Phycisphaerales bacterium]|nr:ChaN family lipoprotein [Phycisphaerales bacterium]
MGQGAPPGAEPAALLAAEPGVEFLASALADHHVVLLGNTHRRPELLAFEAHAVEALAGSGLVTHLGLEIASDQQEALDRFLATGKGLDRIEVAPAIDHPAFRDLLEAIRPLSRPGGGTVEVVALDRPWRSVREGTRDGHMATRIAGEIEGRPGARMLVLVGNNHTLRDFPWRWGGSRTPPRPWRRSRHGCEGSSWHVGGRTRLASPS